ncbi:MAG: cystathionine gamma-synthase family protein [Crocinitomicaceae bacterium]|nr:cystathionine gamma-synthase family protein [Crocinitomicaceae bacterium]
MSDNKNFKPESLMMSYGYQPELSVGSIKCPIYQTSTFTFPNAEFGKRLFSVAYGLEEPEINEPQGLIYSRLNNPDLQILEERLTLWDNAEAGAVFDSGMAAITTVLLEFLKPGDTLLCSTPTYGGTDHFINHILDKFQINALWFQAGASEEEIRSIVEESGKKDSLRLIYIETPANPTNALIDIQMCRKLADEFGGEETVYLAVDNTYMGPIWSNPIDHGADLVLYSATKYIGGHSDVIAGACLGSAALIQRVKIMRTFLGNMADAWTGWLLMRSLETLKVRMEAQAKGAEVVAEFLKNHPKVEKVYYLGFIEKSHSDYAIYQRQYSSAGAMLSFDIKGGEKEAFTFLNNLKLIKLAVSLGGTESLAQHPYSMTHADVDSETKNRNSVTEKLIRISVGIENPEDLVFDMSQSLEKV